MLIPIRDSTIRLKFPFITITILAINILVFIYQSTLSPAALKAWIWQLGVLPANIPKSGLLPVLPSFVTSLFIHGGFLHLAGNMLYLWIFGDNIEITLGHTKFILFYLLCGFMATLIQIIVHPTPDIPIIGASGAISGILGAYLIRYPRAKIQLLFWLIIIVERFWVPAVYVLGFWFLIQIINGLGALTLSQTGGVAWFAHIGGFLSGIGLLLLMEPYERKRLWKRLNQGY